MSPIEIARELLIILEMLDADVDPNPYFDFLEMKYGKAYRDLIESAMFRYIPVVFTTARKALHLE